MQRENIVKRCSWVAKEIQRMWLYRKEMYVKEKVYDCMERDVTM